MQRDEERRVIWHNATVTRTRREAQNGHRGVIVWFTGHSGAGKSTIAHTVEERLHQAGCRTFVFDGDNVRHGLCADLGFSAPDRSENIRRIGEMSKLFIEAGIIALTAFISPFRADRARAHWWRQKIFLKYIVIVLWASVKVATLRVFIKRPGAAKLVNLPAFPRPTRSRKRRNSF